MLKIVEQVLKDNNFKEYILSEDETKLLETFREILSVCDLSLLS